jgi:hypothetical protein
MPKVDETVPTLEVADALGLPPSELATRINNAQRILQDLGFQTVDAIAPRSWPVAGLFHYTSSDGFMSIVESNSLRFSDCFFLNDGSEVHYANQLLLAAVERFCVGKPTMVQKFSRAVRDRIIETAMYARPLIFCLSSKPDLLNQWRDYGRDIVPYCFQLDPNELVKKDWSFQAHLIEMIYDEMVQKAILDDLLVRLSGVLRPLTRQLLDPKLHEWLVGQVVSQVWGVLVQFKNPAYSAEQEWRLIAYSPFIDGQAIEFRTNTLGIVPFISRSPRLGTKLPIQHVWVGPSPWGDVSGYALSIFLRMKGYQQVGVTVSSIPAR